jgi:hypothetical protein
MDDDEKMYKLEEMKQLRTLIVMLVQEIIKLEIFAVTSLAAVIYFRLQYSGQSHYVGGGLIVAPVFLSALILFKAWRFVKRIEVVDDYLGSLETQFVPKSEGAWIRHFRNQYPDKAAIRFERLAICIIVLVVSILLIFVPVSQLEELAVLT